MVFPLVSAVTFRGYQTVLSCVGAIGFQGLKATEYGFLPATLAQDVAT